MFTYIKAKNFKSLKEIYINLKKNKNNVNNFIVIYGENGSGKTNIVEIFKFLQQSILSKIEARKLEALPKEFWQIQDAIEEQEQNPFEEIMNLSVSYEKYRMIDEVEITELEYGFEINGKEGFYTIKFGDAICEEKLYYMIDKQRGYLFELKKDDNIVASLNTKIFNNQKYNKELLELINKYWGKYSFLSLLTFEMLEKNVDYVFSNTSENIQIVLGMFLDMIVSVEKDSPSFFPSINKNFKKRYRIQNICKGRIEKSNKKDLELFERILKTFFTQAYSDIKDVEYKKEDKEDNKVRYTLYFKKIIGGRIRNIPYTQESSGTRRILRLFDSLVGCLYGDIVVIDEIDNGIHDILMRNIIKSIEEYITGQLIVTTHNTLLIEFLSKEYIYILSTNYKGNKDINSIKDLNVNIQKNNNARDLYLKGVFGGIPLTEYIDFEEIKHVIESSTSNEGNNEI